MSGGHYWVEWRGGWICGSIVEQCARHAMNNNSPATVMVTAPSRELAPKHSTTVPSTMEATDSEVRVAVSISPLESVRTPRNAGLPRVLSVLLVLKVMLNISLCGGVMSHRIKTPGRVQVKMTVASGQATVEVDVRAAKK